MTEGGSDLVILGQSFLKNRRTIFDIERSKVIFGSLEECYKFDFGQWVSGVPSIIVVLCVVLVVFGVSYLVCGKLCPETRQKIQTRLSDLVHRKKGYRLNEEVNSQELGHRYSIHSVDRS